MENQIRSGLHHSFDVDIAKEFGLEEAILIHHFQFWIRHNATLGRNFHNERTWMYQSQQEIAALFPYWNRDKVQDLIQKLIKKNVLITGNFNKTKFDKTTWYAFKNEKMFTIVRNRTMDGSKPHNPESETAQPIPDIKPDAEQKTTTPTPSKEEDVVVVSAEKEKEQAHKCYIFYQKIIDEWGSQWNIQENVYFDLIREYGYDYVKEQMIYIANQHRQALKDESISKKKCTPRIDKPEVSIILACERNYAKFNTGSKNK